MFNPNDICELCIEEEYCIVEDLKMFGKDTIFDFCNDCGWCWFAKEEKYWYLKEIREDKNE